MYFVCISACFSSVVENSTTGEVSYNFTEEVLWFRAMHQNISDCFNDTDDVRFLWRKNIITVIYMYWGKTRSSG
jgi:hypothetical protein